MGDRRLHRLWGSSKVWVRRLHPKAAAGQATVLATGRILAALASAVWLVVAAHRLGLSEFGDLTLMLSLASVCNVMGDLGISLAFGVHVANHEGLSGRALRHVLTRRVQRSLIAALIAGGFYLAVAGSATAAVPLLFAVSIVAKGIHTSQSVALRSLNRTYVEAINEFGSRIGVLLLGSLWLVNGGGLLAAAGVYAAADVVSAIAISQVTRKHVSADLGDLPLDELRIRRSFAYAVGTIAATIYASIDIWILAALHGTVVSGHYAAANKILDAALLPAAAVAILGPSRLPRYEPRRQAQLAKQLGGVAVLSVLPALAVTIPFAPQIMGLVFGTSYRSAGLVLVVLMLSGPAGALITAISVPVILRSQRRFLQATVIGLVFNVILNVLLIPRWSGTGAAIANLLSDSALAAILAWMLWSRRRDAAP